MFEPTHVLWYGSLGISLLFCINLLWTGLAKRYPVFTVYVACSLLGSIPALYFMAKANGPRLPLAYTYFWLWSEPILLLLQTGVALEIHAALWKDEASIARSLRPLLFFSLLTAIVFAATPIRSELLRSGMFRLEMVMQFEFVAKRYISTVLAIFLGLSALLYLVAIRNSLRSVLLRHESMLAVSFGIYAVAYFVANMGWSSRSSVNQYMAAAFTLCFVLWISVARPQGRSEEKNSAAGA